MAVAAAPAWSSVILDQLAEADVPDTAVYVVVHVPLEGGPYIVEEGFSATETGAVIVAEDFAATCGGGEVVTVKLAELQAAAEAQARFEAELETQQLPDPTRPTLETSPGDDDDDEPAGEEPPPAATEEPLLDELETQLDTRMQPILSREEQAQVAAEAEAPTAEELDAFVDALDLFDPAPFKVGVTLDGNLTADKLLLRFAGGIELDPNDESDRELFERLRLGRYESFTVHGRITRKVGAWKETAEGKIVATGQATMKVDSIDTE